MDEPYFRILGPVEVEIGGATIRLGPRLRLVLGALLLRANQPVPAAALQQLVGGAAAGPSKATVRSHIQHLRKALEPQRLSWAPPSLLLTRGDGYVLRVGPEQLDAAEFERLAGNGRSALESGDPAAAVEALGAALKLWRGPILGGLASRARLAEAGIDAEAVRLEAIRETATTALAEAERLLAGPSELAPAAPRPDQLPPGPAWFIGRTEELRLLRAHLAPRGGRQAAAVVAVDGKPGVGKSALVISLAHQLAPAFPDGVLYARLRGADADRVPIPAAQALSQLLDGLGVADEVPADIEAASARYRARVATRRVLVVLDDAADAAQVRPLLPGGPRCAALITSRARLGLPEALPLRLELLPERDAIEMLDRVDGTGRVREDPRSAASVARACGRLPLALQIAAGRLGNRPSWTAADLAARLAGEHRRLAELELGDLDVRACFELSYRELEATSQRLFRLLAVVDIPDFTPALAARLLGHGGRGERLVEATLERLVDEQLLEETAPGRYRFHDLVRLFARERAEADEPELERAAARRRVLAWYLATAEQADRLLGPARRDAAPPRDEASDGDFNDRHGAVAWLEGERANLVAVVRQAAEQADPEVAEIAWQLGEALFRFFDLRKHWADWLAVCEPAVRAARRCENRLAEARTVNRLAIVLREQGRASAAIAHLTRALALSRKLGDVDLQGSILNNLGIAHQDEGDLTRAIQCHQQRLELARAVGNRLDQGITLNNLGDIHRQQRHYQQAVECFLESLAIFEALDERRYVGMVLHNLGEVALEERRDHDAADYHRRGLQCSREAEDRFSEAHNLLGLGHATARTRGREEALPMWRLAWEILDDLHAPEAAQARQLLGEEHKPGAQSRGGVA